MEEIACEVLAPYFPGFDVVSVVATETGTQITIRLESGGGSCPDCALGAGAFTAPMSASFATCQSLVDL